MLKRDFERFGITDFTPREVELTGADLSRVDVETFICLQRFRSIIKREVHLIKNGINSGDHKSKEHDGGIAIDCCIYGKLISLNKIIYSAMKAGFTGIGIYYNKQTNIYSFHFDLGRIRMWTAYKETRTAKWKYYGFLLDPKTRI